MDYDLGFTRFILPEHEQLMKRLQQEQKRRQRSEIEEDKLEEINGAIVEATQRKREIVLTLYHPFEDNSIAIRPERVDMARGLLIGLDPYDYKVEIAMVDVLHVKAAAE